MRKIWRGVFGGERERGIGDKGGIERRNEVKKEGWERECV